MHLCVYGLHYQVTLVIIKTLFHHFQAFNV